MDIDPDEDNGPDDGAIEDNIDKNYAHTAIPEPDDDEPHQRKRKKKRQRQAGDSTAGDDEALDAAMPSKLHSDDPGNFLKLCMALKILRSKKITDKQIDETEALL